MTDAPLPCPSCGVRPHQGLIKGTGNIGLGYQALLDVLLPCWVRPEDSSEQRPRAISMEQKAKP